MSLPRHRDAPGDPARAARLVWVRCSSRSLRGDLEANADMGFAPGGRPREKIGGRQDTPPAEPCAPHGGVAWGPPAAHGQWRARAGQARAQRAATLRVGGVPGHGVGPGGLACRARPRAVVARLRTGSAPRRCCGRALRGPAAGLGSPRPRRGARPAWLRRAWARARVKQAWPVGGA